MLTVKNILVPTDFGDAAETALAYARELARRFGATLHVLHIVNNIGAMTVGAPTSGFDLGRLQADLEEAADKQLADLVTAEDRRELRARTVRLTSVSPALEILTYASEHHVDLVVMGTHGRGALAHMLMGSVAERVVRTAPCPVLTVKHPEHEFIRPDALQTVARHE